MVNNKFSLYVHWPFCKKKCPYCDFNSHVASKPIDYELFYNAYCTELNLYRDIYKNHQLKSIFFGGGTPSLMPPELIGKIIDYAKSLFVFTNDIEITMEANPTSIESSNFKEFRNAGVNRVSIGIQSFDDNELKLLGRNYTAVEARQALEVGYNVFSNISFDVIYSLPGQSLEKWIKNLDEILKYNPNHISLYQLTIEEKTNFYKLYQKGLLELPSGDEQIEMYNHTLECLKKHGLYRYEVSNFAKSEDFESVHNKNYWNYGEFIGIGAGAHGRVINSQSKLCSTVNYKMPTAWLKNNAFGFCEYEQLEEICGNEISYEYMIMSMRTKYGIDVKRYEMILEKYGGQDMLDYDKVSFYEKQGLLINNGENIYATNDGFLVLNSLIEGILK